MAHLIEDNRDLTHAGSQHKGKRCKVLGRRNGKVCAGKLLIVKNHAIISVAYGTSDLGVKEVRLGRPVGV